MPLTVSLFGQLSDITGSNIIEVENVIDTNSLINNIKERFPLIKDNKFAVAVDKKIIRENTLLTEQSLVALLPPFSGG
ncbi:MoaD/ThiS family protein [Segetibacter sp. 3557_3]|uniref:MoaD/ThiS family protein n=1 Tax=Segetibacter sp. 3557_3 TaxID=2547429 RepID=UPI0010587C18|nr:MoaD/ThiS family protein [Segetibacter sp. 3557_3]TDH21462.1 MoaD/ThiS family protein [Segetibacter sp. 3557_3]